MVNGKSWITKSSIREFYMSISVGDIFITDIGYVAVVTKLFPHDVEARVSKDDQMFTINVSYTMASKGKRRYKAMTSDDNKNGSERDKSG